MNGFNRKVFPMNKESKYTLDAEIMKELLKARNRMAILFSVTTAEGGESWLTDLDAIIAKAKG